MLKYSVLTAVALTAATPAFAQEPASLTGGHVEAIAGWDLGGTRHQLVAGLGVRF